MIVNKPHKKKQLSRYTSLLIIMSIIFTTITFRLLYIQIYKHEDYKEKADTTSSRFISEKAPRGKIYDKQGNVLASNTQTYSLTYTTTQVADKAFFSTMDEVLKVLKDNGKSYQDNLNLKLNEKNEWYIEYKNTDETLRKNEEIRFKRDRSLNGPIERELFPNKEDDFDDDDTAKVNAELLKITPEEVYYSLVKSYGLINLIYPNPTDEQAKEFKNMSGEELAKIVSEKYNYAQQREYMVIKDALKMQSYKGFKSVTIASNIDRDIAFTIKQMLNELPGIDVTQDPIRSYPYGSLGASVLGYLSSIDNSQKENYELRGYDVSSDLIGMSGIESAFEEQLKGVKGGTNVKVNSVGRVTEELFKLESYPGNDVHLTIDKDVQSAAEKALEDTMNNIKQKNNGEFRNSTRGAVVAVEVKTGRILASASYPTFDPNEFVIPGQLSTAQYKKYFNPDLEEFGNNYIKENRLNMTVDDLFPDYGDGQGRRDQHDIYPRYFYNYATQGLLPPGSILKPLTGVAGFENGVIDATTIIVDQGKFTQHKDVYGSEFGPECLIYTEKKQTHGPTDIGKALEVSCNYYFYEVAYRLYDKAVKEGKGMEARDTIAHYAWKFGLGYDPDSKAERGTGIEIEERTGQVYSFKAFKEENLALYKYDLNKYLESGVYGGYNFIPFDYSYRDEDSEKLNEAKKSLKEKIDNSFKKLGTSEEVSNFNGFSKSLLNDIKSIMNNSDRYKANVKTYEASGKKYDEEAQANAVAGAIAQFTIYDRAGEIKSPGQEVYASIGQGMNNFTPMELAGYVATLANGGTRYKLHFVDKITTPDGKVVQEFQPEVLDTVSMKPSTLSAIKEGMRRANNDEGGSAAAAFRGFPMNTGGKTGTADFNPKIQKEIGRAPYATYVSFAPLEDPEIAFVGVIYDGGHGYWTAPIARAVYEAYYKDKLLQDNPGYTSETFQKYVITAPADNKESK